jgi:hypothetical protein
VEVLAYHISDLSYGLGIAAHHESLSDLDDHSMVDQRFCNVVVVADSRMWPLVSLRTASMPLWSTRVLRPDERVMHF